MKTLENDPQLKKVLEIMEHLNAKKAYYAHYFDCGELGILRIWWMRSSWEWQWIEIEQDPTGDDNEYFRPK